MKFIQPKIKADSFTCPHCGVLSKIDWNYGNWYLHNGGNYDNVIWTGHCQHCNEHTMWIKDKMYYPDTGSSPFPNPVMPESVRKLYLEAASIMSKSPRGAAALLRLAIQILCVELGESGKNINEDIKKLVKKGLPEIVQQSLDIVRVTGNDAVHPGQIDTDDINVTNNLFELTNIIVEYMIALPQKVSGLYTSLPKDKLDSIKQRDK